MWIRTPDKEKMFEINMCFISYPDENNKFQIRTILNDYQEVLGEYSSHEKALKVLDEIQKCASGYSYINYVGWGNYDASETIKVEPKNFYQMPQDDAVI